MRSTWRLAAASPFVALTASPAFLANAAVLRVVKVFRVAGAATGFDVATALAVTCGRLAFPKRLHSSNESKPRSEEVARELDDHHFGIRRYLVGQLVSGESGHGNVGWKKRSVLVEWSRHSFLFFLRCEIVDLDKIKTLFNIEFLKADSNDVGV